MGIRGHFKINRRVNGSVFGKGQECTTGETKISKNSAFKTTYNSNLATQRKTKSMVILMST